MTDEDAEAEDGDDEDEAEPIEIRVPRDADGERLDRFLTEFLDGPSRARIQKHIEAGAITVGGVLPKPRTLVHADEIIRYVPPPPEVVDLLPEDIPLSILYEDEHLLIVDKPKDMVVHPAAGHRSGTLANAVLFHLGRQATRAVRAGIVHRLDRGTSGAMVVAKTETMQERLSALFAERRVEKIYLAVALGVPKDRRATIDTLYGRHPTDRKRFSSRVKRGKRAVTHYEVKEELALKKAALLEVRLETGRTHQIRVHLADRGHPLAGDETYGGKRAKEIDRSIDRPALHAHRLAFDHPATGERVQAVAPIPEDLVGLIERLRRGGGVS